MLEIDPTASRAAQGSTYRTPELIERKRVLVSLQFLCRCHLDAIDTACNTVTPRVRAIQILRISKSCCVRTNVARGILSSH